ncbi:protein kinase [Terrilactibacillus sp. S3-3]|nr:protein kinase [Terrilactibacillus sp. S3-3]
MIDRRISGRYKILSRLGDGGMAIVYKAKDLILDRIVAVKILRSDLAGDDEFIRRFHREAESVASLSHPNIVNIYDIGEEDDCYFIVMEYVQGTTLKTFIRDYSPIPVEETVHIMKQILLAIAHAHERGIVHRDIKPHNILIDENENVKVTDFGIACRDECNHYLHKFDHGIGSLFVARTGKRRQSNGKIGYLCARHRHV